jgi:hypothetical protein
MWPIAQSLGKVQKACKSYRTTGCRVQANGNKDEEVQILMLLAINKYCSLSKYSITVTSWVRYILTIRRCCHHRNSNKKVFLIVDIILLLWRL